MTTTMTRRRILGSALPAAALAATAPSATADDRPLAAHLITTIDHWDHVPGWVCADQDIACCTADERRRLIAERPDVADWRWVRAGDRHVGMSAVRPSANTAGDPDAVVRRFLDRMADVRGQRRTVANA